MLKAFLLLVASLYLASAFVASESNATVQPTTYVYKTVGNLSIEADVYVPSITVQGKHPVALCIHGGGYIGGSKTMCFTAPELQEMLSRGWCVVSIDYRLAPEALLADMMLDIQDAYAWIHTELASIVPLKLDSVFVMGPSGGGALAVICGYMLSPRPQAVLSLYPGWTNFSDPLDYNATFPAPADLVEEVNTCMKPEVEHDLGDWSNITDPRIHLFLSANDEHMLGWMLATHNPNETTKSVYQYLSRYSAVDHIDSKYPATVLVHGLDDDLVPHDQSVELAEQLAKNNVPYKLSLVPGVGHGFDYKPGMTSDVFNNYIVTAFDFVEKYLNTNSIIN